MMKLKMVFVDEFVGLYCEMDFKFQDDILQICLAKKKTKQNKETKNTHTVHLHLFYVNRIFDIIVQHLFFLIWTYKEEFILDIDVI